MTLSEIQANVSSNLGMKRLPSTAFKKGSTPWNKGKTGIYSQETLEKMSKAKKGKGLSKGHRRKMSLAKKGKTPNNIVAGWNKGKKSWWVMGKKNPNWKGGVSKVNRTNRANFMGTIEYKIWRKFVFKRDNFTCQICGKREGNLRANHIKRYADYPDLRIEKNNGITICKECDYAWVFNNEPEWESYFNFNLETREVLQ